MSLDLKRRALDAYCVSARFVFFFFLLGTLAFGRAFSALHINIPLCPLFITELVLIFNLPLLFFRRKELSGMPRRFGLLLLAYTIYSSSYLVMGVIKGNYPALRDVTVSLYALFIPITVINLSDTRSIRRLVFTIITANVINIYAGMCKSLDRHPNDAIRVFLDQAKMLNYGMYYAMACAFILALYAGIKGKALRFFAVVLLSLNIYMLIECPSTSMWAATLPFLAFLAVALRKNLVRPALVSIVGVMAINIMFLTGSHYKQLPIYEFFGQPRKASSPIYANTPDSIVKDPEKIDEIRAKSFEEAKVGNIIKEAKGVQIFFSNKLYLDRLIEQAPSAASTEETNALNINWRLTIWKQTLKFARDSLIFGKGFGTYPVYKIRITHQSPTGMYLNSNIVPAHNHLITIFFKMGIIGLVLFICLNGAVFYYGCRYMSICRDAFLKSVITALLGTFVFWHILAMFFDVIDSPPIGIFFWVIAGAIIAVVNVDRDVINGSAGDM
jgi:hypothetical protein